MFEIRFVASRVSQSGQSGECCCACPSAVLGREGGGGKPLGGYRESPSAGTSVEVCWPSPDCHCLRDVHDVFFELSGWNVVISDLDCFIALRTQTYRSCSLDV